MNINPSVISFLSEYFESIGDDATFPIEKLLEIEQQVMEFVEQGPYLRFTKASNYSRCIARSSLIVSSTSGSEGRVFPLFCLDKIDPRFPLLTIRILPTRFPPVPL